MTTPIRIAVTGAGGQIGYALIFRVASGGLFGPDQPVSLRLLEITPALPALNGTLMELDDWAGYGDRGTQARGDSLLLLVLQTDFLAKQLTPLAAELQTVRQRYPKRGVDLAGCPASL